MRKQNHWKRNQKIAVLAAGSLLAQCVGAGMPVKAEIKSVGVSEGMAWEKATASQVGDVLDDGIWKAGEKASDSNAEKVEDKTKKDS